MTSLFLSFLLLLPSPPSRSRHTLLSPSPLRVLSPSLKPPRQHHHPATKPPSPSHLSLHDLSLTTTSPHLSQPRSLSPRFPSLSTASSLVVPSPSPLTITSHSHHEIPSGHSLSRRVPPSSSLSFLLSPSLSSPPFSLSLSIFSFWFFRSSLSFSGSAAAQQV